MEGEGRAFADDTELAEMASLGVRLAVDAGRGAIASVLQPVARAAWARVEDGGDDGELLEECARAHAALRMRVGATGERRFLASVVAHLTGPGAARAGSGHKIDGDRG
jgi:hypothetical protein